MCQYVFCAATETLVQGTDDANKMWQAFIWTISSYVTNGVRQDKGKNIESILVRCIFRWFFPLN